MLNLELELVAVLILTAVIGLLMGRFLCKSGESEEREEKKKIIHAFKTSQHELELSRENVNEQFLSLKERANTIAEYEQEINNFETKLKSSDEQRVKLLEELKTLEKYKPRFESLDREFHLQSKIVEGLNGEKIENQKEISDFKILTNGLDKNVNHLKEKQKELEGTVSKLNATLKQQSLRHEQATKDREKTQGSLLVSKESNHEKALSTIQQKYETLLKSKESAYEQLAEETSFKFKKMKEEKEDLYAKLEEKMLLQFKEMSKNKDTAYEKLQHDTEKKYKEIVNLKDDAYETLEQSKSKAYQEMLESKVESYDSLKKEKESIEDEYEEFKINYHLDNNRLDTLEGDHEKLYRTLETIVVERDDLMARLRAISSVVGAVGVDRVENPPALLEN